MIASDPKITAIAPWFGAKRNIAHAIVDALGPHSAYWEPFCGSMAVLLAKPPSSHEHVNDLHGDLINLARVIQDEVAGPRLYRRLRRTLFVEAFHGEAKLALMDSDLSAEDCAYSYFVMSWMGRNGVSGTCKNNQTVARRFTKNGGHGGLRFANAVASIPAWRRRLRRTTIMQRCGFQLLDDIEDQRGTAIYLDPPYVEKGAKYEHDFGDKCKACGEIHTHEELAALASRFKAARVVVSYYAHPTIDALYRDWQRIEINVSKAMAHQGRRGKNGTRAVELLLVNQRMETRNLFEQHEGE